jgi:hypothetical protein
MAMNDRHLPRQSNRQDIDAFLDKVSNMRPHNSTAAAGRLLFAMDATASREPTWDHACHLQSRMFETSKACGGLAIQLCYYRSLNEFHCSAWHHHSDTLLREMNAVRCLAGHTQIEKVLSHALGQPELSATVFIGDAMEENSDHLRLLAGKLGLLGRPVFIFHEGRDAIARASFSDIARLSHGACCPFDINSPEQLRELLGAVAVYASGGYRALVEHCKHQPQGDQTLGLTLLRQLEGPNSSRQRRDRT